MWTRLALALACLSGGIEAYIRLNKEANKALELIPFPMLTFCLPALLLAAAQFGRTLPGSMGRHPAVVFSVLVSTLSLTWTMPQDRGRGLLIVAVLGTSTMISGLIRDRATLRWCAGCFALGCLLHLACIIQAGMYDLGRFGYGKGSNPNGFGADQGMGAIVCLTIFLLAPNEGRDRLGALARFGWGGVALVLLGSAVLSASRGAILMLSVALTLSLVLGRVSVHRLMLAMCSLLVGVSAVLADFGMLETALSRFADTQGVASAGDRVYVWAASWEMFTDHVLKGVGIGSVEVNLAEYAAGEEGMMLGEDGFLRKSPHSAYLEWLCALGLLGTIPAALGLLTVGRRAIQLDTLEGTVHRRVLMAAAMIMGLSITLQRLPFIVPFAAILLSQFPRTLPTAPLRATPRHTRPPSQARPQLLLRRAA